MSNRTRTWYFISFLLALLLKQFLVYYFNSVYDDQVSQLLGAININKGAGYTIESVSTYDLSASMPQRMVGWPPIPSYLLAAMLKLTGNDFYLACYWMDALLAFLQVTVVAWMMFQIRLPLLVSCLFILMAGADLNDFIRDSTFSDLMGLDCMLISFTCLWHYFKRENLPAAIAASFFAVAAAYVKYHYVPVAVFLPVLLTADAWLSGKRSGWKPLFLLVIAVTILVGSQFVINRLSGSSSFYIYPTEQGFFPENMQHLYPFLWAGWMDIIFIHYQFVIKLGISHSVFNSFLYVSNLLFLLGFLVLFFRMLAERIRGQQYSSTQRFSFAILSLSICIAAFLFLLSLSRSYFNPVDTQNWTFISEFRYFNTASFGLNLFTLLLLHKDKSMTRSFWPESWLRQLLLLLMVIQVSHAAWFAARRAVSGTIFDNSTFEHRPDYAFLLQLVAEERGKGWDVVLTSDNLNIAAFCNIYGIKTLMTSHRLLTEQVSTSAPVCLILRIPDRNFVIYRTVISRYKMELVGTVGENNYYKNYIYPGKNK